MGARRGVLAVTCVVVAVFGVVFTVIRWEQADRIATAVSALGALAAVGVAVWAALPGTGTRTRVRVSGTGKAVSGPGGQAVTGVSGAVAAAAGEIVVERTGDADASEGGDATSGVRLT
ncbi:hypothetical protein [Streptosporangium carneum]|uniref:Uncharacterized protein n=1 Tax=Streptosporangium carneum TaxID=47481 RepID=A0A9W6I9Y6_9ACTN|nr:hypothetical protein [Streptosporangium carneum]GLK14790.1 hypothetical protein GCM10017600_82020 [Streptosporangium carneum]